MIILQDLSCSDEILCFLLQLFMVAIDQEGDMKVKDTRVHP